MLIFIDELSHDDYTYTVDIRYRRNKMKTFFNIALIITSVATVVCVVLQNRGVGMGSIAGSDPGSIFTARRGVEKVIFNLTMVFSILLVIEVILSIILFK